MTIVRRSIADRTFAHVTSSPYTWLFALVTVFARASVFACVTVFARTIVFARARAFARLEIVACVMCAFACASTAFAQPNSFPPALAQRMSEALEVFRAATGVTGASAAIISPRFGEWTGAAGMSHPANAIPLTSSMLFGIGSITKTLTSAAILQLEDEGRLSIDDSIGMYGFSGRSNIDGAITIRHLLQHTSGLFDYTQNPQFFNAALLDAEHVFTTDEVLEFVGPPTAARGTEWRYSNTGYVILGGIIEQITGNAYSDEIARRFLDPLELSSTEIGWSTQFPGVLTANWFDLDGDGFVDDMRQIPRQGLYSGAGAAGGYVSTAMDIAKWGFTLYSGQVLSAAALTKMMTAIDLSIVGPGFGYGLGAMRASINNRLTWGHTGGIPGFNSALIFAAADSTTIVILVNQTTQAASDIAHAMLASFYASATVGGERDRSASLRAYPNPFHERLWIMSRDAAQKHARIRVYTVIGEPVRELAYDVSASNEIVWDGTDDSGVNVPPGVYMVQLQNGERIETITVVRQ